MTYPALYDLRRAGRLPLENQKDLEVFYRLISNACRCMNRNTYHELELSTRDAAGNAIFVHGANRVAIKQDPDASRHRKARGQKAASTDAKSIGGEVRSAFLSSTILSRVICQQCPPLVSCI